jgi:aminopeptidase N
MSKGTSPKAILRKNYTPYPWLLKGAKLRFEIDDETTRVLSALTFEANPAAQASKTLKLDGQSMELLSVSLDGRRLQSADYEQDRDHLVVPVGQQPFLLETEVLIRPRENTALEGLYMSGDFLLTQCEAEGFRKITYFPDRPDVMTVFDVTLEADRDRFPVLLSNGNVVETGEANGGRHWVRWVDPFAKPSYLFALVAGDLACVEDRFTTSSGRDVSLRFYVEHENADRCDHAMESLINAMKWDESRFGLEYDLDIYNVVATNDFNMGAMENKSLNIFNSRYVLASPESATDSDYQGIESVIGHEYFHNWTGNRVTCRDWFQLTLKEGLTVFRDQEFTSDLQSRAVKRIQDVRNLRSSQFPEDAGPMAHPIRPDRYKEISNFYTMTVYRKGAEIIRMYHTLLGEEGFQRGMRLYFERHDGQAVTCDDFLAAMADANDVDFERFGRWYGQSGTPVVSARGEFDEGSGTYTLTLAQHTAPTLDQAEKQPLLIPVRAALISKTGNVIPARVGDLEADASGSVLLILDMDEKRFVFRDVPEQPVPSLLRDFSAPVRLEFDASPADLAVLMAHDNNAFVRWESAQSLASRAILANVERRAAARPMHIGDGLVAAFRALLADGQTDPALVAEAIMLPDEEYLGGQVDEVDVDGIHAARCFVRAELAGRLEDDFLARYHAMSSQGPYDKSAASMARRSLRNACLPYLMETTAGEALAETQLDRSDNMTDALAALRALVHHRAGSSQRALDAFESRWRHDALVMDKWFAIQASIPGPDTLETVQHLLAHPGFSLKNPNKVRAVIGVFATLNPTGFHAAHGGGYRFLTDRVIALDALNPQIAARMVSAFNSWTRYDADRSVLMRTELKRIAGYSTLSPDVSEIVGNALRMDKGRPENG